MPLSPDLFKRLSALNRRRLSRQMTTGRDLAAADRPRPQPDTGDAAATTLEALIPGREHDAPGGRCYLISRPAEHFLPPPVAGDADGADLVSRYRHVVCGAGRAVEADALDESLRPLAASAASAVAYLDIETCGLAGEPVFLVGLLRWRDEGLRVRQFLARDYAEEGPMLAAVWKALADVACLVTYNGKAFDLPTLAARSLACGLFDVPAGPVHVDLLPEARRRWRAVLPNCRLQTVEQGVLGRRRGGDIPGCDIPAAYHDFVRSRQAGDPRSRRRSLRRMQTILHHNALDLLTLAEVVVHLFSGGA